MANVGQTYESASGSGIQVFFGDYPVSNLTSVSLTITSDAKPLYGLGSKNPTSIAKGKRTIVGSLSGNVILGSVFRQLIANSRGNYYNFSLYDINNNSLHRLLGNFESSVGDKKIGGLDVTGNELGLVGSLRTGAFNQNNDALTNDSNNLRRRIDSYFNFIPDVNIERIADKYQNSAVQTSIPTSLDETSQFNITVVAFTETGIINERFIGGCIVTTESFNTNISSLMNEEAVTYIAQSASTWYIPKSTITRIADRGTTP